MLVCSAVTFTPPAQNKNNHHPLSCDLENVLNAAHRPLTYTHKHKHTHTYLYHPLLQFHRHTYVCAREHQSKSTACAMHAHIATACHKLIKNTAAAHIRNGRAIVCSLSFNNVSFVRIYNVYATCIVYIINKYNGNRKIYTSGVHSIIIIIIRQ